MCKTFPRVERDKSLVTNNLPIWLSCWVITDSWRRWQARWLLPELCVTLRCSFSQQSFILLLPQTHLFSFLLHTASCAETCQRFLLFFFLFFCFLQREVTQVGWHSRNRCCFWPFYVWHRRLFSFLCYKNRSKVNNNRQRFSNIHHSGIKRPLLRSFTSELPGATCSAQRPKHAPAADVTETHPHRDLTHP